MEFVHNIIANNTKFNVAWLEFIGYTNSGVDPEDEFIITSTYQMKGNVKHFKEPIFWSIDRENIKEFEDCFDMTKDNLLFKALSAIRNDSDIHQWFIADTDFSDERTYLFCNRDNIKDLAIDISFTKATAFDIINNFKK